MTAPDLVELLRTASRAPLGLIGLITISVAVLARLRTGRREGSQASALWILLALGVAAFGGAVSKAVPRSPVSEGVSVENGKVIIRIDRSTDYSNGLPSGVFDPDRTNHMMRQSAAGWMWTMAGSTFYNVGWVIHPPRAGRYALSVRYAAKESCTAEVRMGEETLFPGLAKTTGDDLKPAWFEEGIVDLKAGDNHLWFHSERGLPNIDALRLTELKGS